MNLSLLKVFYEVSRCGSLTTAAEQLHISQPALSRQISSLEKEVGIDLFIRHSRGLQLTEAGRRLYDYAQRILNYADEAQRVLDEIKNLETGTLTIGASKTIGSYLLPPVIAKFMQQYPGIDLAIEIDNRDTIIKRAANYRYNFALLTGSFNEPGFYIETLFNDRVVALTSPQHKVQTNGVSDVESLNQEIFILREVGSSTRKISDLILTKHGIQPKKVMELPSIEAIKKTVASGTGITFLSKYAVRDELQSGALQTIEHAGLHMPRGIIAIHTKAGSISPAALALISLIKKELHFSH